MKKLLSIITALLTVLSLGVITSFAGELENVAPEGSYTVTGILTDEDGKTWYPDETGDCLINGVFAQTAGYDQTDFVGLNITAADAKEQGGVTSVALDLGEVYPIVKAAVSCSNLQTSGIQAPAAVTVTVSADGKTWSDPINAEYEFELIPGEVIKAVADVNAEVRYITFTFQHASNWVFIDEIEAYAGNINESAESDGNDSLANSEDSAEEAPEKKTDINSDVIYVSAAVISVVILIVTVVFTRKKK